MPVSINVQLKPDFVSKIQSGYPLILKEFISDWSKVKEEGTLLNLHDAKNNFIAQAYYGIQNKGYGWVISKDKNEVLNSDFFAKKLKVAFNYRRDFYKDTTTTAFRVFNGEGDNLGGITIDYFDGYYLFTWYSLGIYEHRKEILEAFKQTVSYKGIYQKKRFDGKGKYLDEKDDFLFGVKAPEPLIIKENGVNFAIYLDDGAMVGVFLDQREVRKTLRDQYSKNKTLLNTFSYTGAFSVFSAIGGAKTTTSVDLAKRSLPKTTEQFIINNINIEKQNIIVEDVFNYFKYAVRKKMLFDVVVVDPPSFARSKKHTFSANKDYTKLLKEIIQITNVNGVIVASTNSANFSMMKFHDYIALAFKESKKKYKVLQSFSLPKDFKISEHFIEGNYLKVVFIKRVT